MQRKKTNQKYFEMAIYMINHVQQSREKSKGLTSAKEAPVRMYEGCNVTDTIKS